MIATSRKTRRLFMAFLVGALPLGACSEHEQPGQAPLTAMQLPSPIPTPNILLYAAGNRRSYVLSYPAGALVGTINRPSFGACSDSAGNVYLTGRGSVAEYAYGQTIPFATASVPGTAYSCSVDPVTGDLAVVVFCKSGCGDEVAVFTSLKYPPQLYQTSGLTQILYCGYDGGGNLFVDGYNKQHFALAELPAGGASLSSISVDQAINVPGQVQWDGSHITVEDAYDPVIYQFAISGSSASVVGSTQMHPIGRRATESWILPGIVAVPTGPNGKRAIEIGIWLYPGGGGRLALFKGFITPHKEITGVTMSVLPSGGPR